MHATQRTPAKASALLVLTCMLGLVLACGRAIAETAPAGDAGSEVAQPSEAGAGQRLRGFVQLRGAAVPPDSHESAISRHFKESLAKVQPILARYGYAAAAGAALLEGIGVPTPGQTLLIASALEAANGGMSLPVLLILVAVASSIGSSIGYAIGRFGGHALLTHLRLNPARRERIEGFFARRGGVVVLLGRFVDGLRQLSGIVAGSLEMPWWTFTAYNVAGAVLWTGAWGVASYFLGRDIHLLASFAVQHKRTLMFLTVLAIVALVAYLIGPRWTRNAQPRA